MTARPALVLDFDGTVVSEDIGDALCDRFAPPSWRSIDARWLAGELSLDDAQRHMWALVRAEPADFLAHAIQIGQIRPGFDALIEWARARDVRLILASGGFEPYIRAILGSRMTAFEAVYANAARFVGGRVEVSFPHKEVLGCSRCAVCKGAVVSAVRQGSQPVWFVGDGHSDFCAAGAADIVFAVVGRPLASRAAERGVQVVEFESFATVIGELASRWKGA